MLKKILSGILASVFLMSTVCLAAKPGDVAGQYYYTDIKTYMRGQLLDSYNVGGKTVILCEALSSYGFSVAWDGAARSLTITDIKGSAESNATVSASGILGAVAGNYFHTDIVTVFNGTKMESYNIGGQTVIPATDLGKLGYEVIWDAENRRVLIDTDPNKIAVVVDKNIKFDNLQFKSTTAFRGTTLMRASSPSFNGNELVMEHNCFIETAMNDKYYIPFKSFADCLGIAYSWNSNSATITVNVPSDKEIKAANSKAKSKVKLYENMAYELKDIVLNIKNDSKTTPVDAVAYGTEIFIETQNLASALNMFCINGTDFYTETMMYHLYSGLYN